MHFLILSNAKINFTNWKLNWKLYTTIETINYQVDGFAKKEEFVAITFDPKNEIFVVHIASLTSCDLNVNLFCKVQIVSLIVDKIFILVPIEYTNFVKVFSSNFAAQLPEHSRINNHSIKIIKGQQLFYRFIYSLRPVE